MLAMTLQARFRPVLVAAILASSQQVLSNPSASEVRGELSRHQSAGVVFRGKVSIEYIREGVPLSKTSFPNVSYEVIWASDYKAVLFSGDRGEMITFEDTAAGRSEYYLSSHSYFNDLPIGKLGPSQLALTPIFHLTLLGYTEDWVREGKWECAEVPQDDKLQLVYQTKHERVRQGAPQQVMTFTWLEGQKLEFWTEYVYPGGEHEIPNAAKVVLGASSSVLPETFSFDRFLGEGGGIDLRVSGHVSDMKSPAPSKADFVENVLRRKAGNLKRADYGPAIYYEPYTTENIKEHVRDARELPSALDPPDVRPVSTVERGLRKTRVILAVVGGFLILLPLALKFLRGRRGGV